MKKQLWSGNSNTFSLESVLVDELWSTTWLEQGQHPNLGWFEIGAVLDTCRDHGLLKGQYGTATTSCEISIIDKGAEKSSCGRWGDWHGE